MAQKVREQWSEGHGASWGRAELILWQLTKLQAGLFEVI